MPQYEGRLELTWTNKHLRLLAQEDGSYEWVDPADYRVAEVRLLHDISTVGEVGIERAADNLLIRGDALNALTSLARLPEFADEYLGKVKLVYIDPPFNTQQSFLHYDDALEHSVWLTMMRDRLLQIRELLAQNGSLWLHLDSSEIHRARCVLDEVFGADQFVAQVVVELNPKGRQLDRFFAGSHDYLLVYAKDLSTASLRCSSVDAVRLEDFPLQELDGRRYRLLPLRNTNKLFHPGTRPNLHFPLYGNPATGGVSLTGYAGYHEILPVFGDGSSAVWRWSQPLVNQRYPELLAKSVSGRLGTRLDIFQKDYFTEDRTKKIKTVWLTDEVGNSDTAKREIKSLIPDAPPFATPKPERLMRRIVEIATKPGDIVLDCFLGSGTTAAVAHKMGRRWVGIEREPQTITDFAQPRLGKVVRGEDLGAITESVNWSGGGGFRILDVAPSMFDAQDGLVFLADWMVNGALAEATAAQFGFDYEPDAPFAGRKGRVRLAVVDGVVNEQVVRLLVNALPERERVVVCGTGIDTDARAVLRELRPGSTLRKIPAALLDAYRTSQQLRLEPMQVIGTVEPKGAQV